MKSRIPFFQLALLMGLLQFSAVTVNAQNTLQAVDDTIDLYPQIPTVYNILANDSIPAGDTVKNVIISTNNYITCAKQGNSVFTFTLRIWGCGPESSTKYLVLTQSGDTSSATIHFKIHDRSFAYLDINNVKARFCANGSHFFFENAEYEVPKGSGKTSIFSNTFWIGGKDGQQQLHFAGMRYGQGPSPGPANTKHDFFPGPIMDSAYYSIYQDTVWNRAWRLTKSEIDYHRAHYWEIGYNPIPDIATWPGNGNTAMGQAQKLGPFSDRNGDGHYDPLDGDYPEIRGDQAIFFIFNDDSGLHAESLGEKLRIEIHGMAYAFDLPGDSALKNTTFLYYKVFNRSQNIYDSTLMGVFTDIDLGFANDDYTGCDVERNMYFGYNGTPVDGSGQPFAYGANPPAQSVTILAGPYLDPDGIDNPRYDQLGNQLCDFSVNGLNFGDSIVDNERFGMQRFIYCNNSNSGVPAYMTDPNIAPEYYDLMSGKWKDGTPVVYGGNGHPSSGGYGPASRFMYPGESDTLNWGTGCVPPNGPVNWTEETAQNNPQDRRGVGVTGPFTFGPGDVQEIDIAFSWARDYGGESPLTSLAKLRQVVSEINTAFAKNELSNGQPFYGITDVPATELAVKIYPNPAVNIVNIDFISGLSLVNTTIDLMTSQGSSVKRVTLNDRCKSFSLDVTNIPSGLYLIKVASKDSKVIKKIVVMH